MFYTVRHRTEFRYSHPVREGVMEVRTQPRSEGHQRCLTFDLSVTPPTRVMSYQDFLGNIVHHFDIPGAFSELTVTAQALVEVQPQPDLETVSIGDWKDLDAQVAGGDYWDMLAPSRFALPTPLLHELARDLRAERRDQPLEVLRELNDAITMAVEYVPNSTKVDSPIDEALR
ncbi:MAG TPA: transglutaminase N-terminal domain-containing protein, partial [Terriglobia bacterium]|nr:transglutaminase N-terminal domain-containing protein [Terriglobia bacterium]